MCPSAFALQYILRLSSCRLTEGFVMPPCLTLRSKESNSAWPLRSIRITRLRRYYGPLRHPVCLRPFSRVHSYRTDLPPRISPGASRTSPVSVVSLFPCRRHYPAGVGHPFSQPAIAHSVFTSFRQVRPPEFSLNEACSAFTCVATRSLAHQPEADFVGRLQHLDYSPCCYPS